ncbi:GNAT family N-acetyltransferase [Gluconacetobacter diazotrophicus]|uniref:Putative Acetyltransferase n=1 Tax=Gluconacetobacter diazotrophicus (strain ATCC 49037 / DSM 5601 / CCUG 37298 / CIP 103539 / LMG 7603 / PAl5) TaxID=272568 RepID=A9H723_GLUDA|nr:GNAT family N-acetyltransferase [Gluconacetobacter diazotrophicus]CAP57585.1 putative Acetyltransferase [Gluconacetobacter diazotrophicus PA1 5]
MPVPLQIRLMTASDFDAVWPILRGVVQARETYAWDPEMDRAEGWRLWAALPRATYVAERDGVILGSYYIKLNAGGPGDHVCNAGYIVAPEARGQGVAGALCAHSLAAARRMGFAAMQFNAVVASNHVAVRLWRKHGFIIVGTVPGAYRHATLGRVDCHIMYRPLDDLPEQTGK